jgi:hypothetical protein
VTAAGAGRRVKMDRRGKQGEEDLDAATGDLQSTFRFMHETSVQLRSQCVFDRESVSLRKSAADQTSGLGVDPRESTKVRKETASRSGIHNATTRAESGRRLDAQEQTCQNAVHLTAGLMKVQPKLLKLLEQHDELGR